MPSKLMLPSCRNQRQVVEHNRAADAGAAAREIHRQERDEQANLMKAWKDDDAKRIERNEARTSQASIQRRVEAVGGRAGNGKDGKTKIAQTKAW